MTGLGFTVEGTDDQGWLVIRVDADLFTPEEITRFLNRLLADRATATDA
jgi:hypothetical protein